MKKLRIITGITLLAIMQSFVTFGQTTDSTTVSYLEKDYETMYVGFGTGLNNYTGLIGGLIEVPLNENLVVQGAIGLGTWGYKFGGSVGFYIDGVQQGGEFSLGYTIATGSKEPIETKMELSNKSEQDVLILYKPAGTVNLAYNYNIKMGRANKFVISVGYAFGVSPKAWELKSTGVKLSSTSESVVNAMQPSGLLFGLHLLFGL